MAKNTSKKIKELKGIKPEKVSKEHLDKVQSAVSDINNAYMELGRLSATSHNFLHELAGRQDKLTLLQQELKKEYGTDDINIQDGAINYADDVEVNS
jgi:hypothetical protein